MKKFLKGGEGGGCVLATCSSGAGGGGSSSSSSGRSSNFVAGQDAVNLAGKPAEGCINQGERGKRNKNLEVSVS